MIACVLSATALSWHGVLLAETARAAPEDMRGGVTGGVLSFGQVGGLALPLVYSTLLDTTGSYAVGFIVCGVPSLWVGVQLLRRLHELPDIETHLLLSQAGVLSAHQELDLKREELMRDLAQLESERDAKVRKIRGE